MTYENFLRELERNRKHIDPTMSEFMDDFRSLIYTLLIRGEKVKIKGLCTFYVVDQKRFNVNTRTTTISREVRIKPSYLLRRYLKI